MFGQTGIAARTDYLVEDERTCTLYITANKRNGTEGRVFCARTQDGGKSFQFLAWIGEEPAEADGFAIMPASARLDPNSILVANRCRGGVGPSSACTTSTIGRTETANALSKQPSGSREARLPHSDWTWKTCLQTKR